MDEFSKVLLFARLLSMEAAEDCIIYVDEDAKASTVPDAVFIVEARNGVIRVESILTGKSVNFEKGQLL